MPLNLDSIAHKERKNFFKEFLSPKLCITFQSFLLFLYGEARKAWSKPLITPYAPGEFDFSAPSRKRAVSLVVWEGGIDC